MKKAGGKREGAGRKPAPFKTKTISFRVNEEWADELLKILKEKITEFKNGKER